MGKNALKLIFIVLLFSHLFGEPKIVKIFGTHLYITGKNIKKGDYFLVFSANNSFKAEVMVTQKQKGIFIAKQLQFSSVDFEPAKFSYKDKLVPFHHYSAREIFENPDYYLNSYIRLTGVLVSKARNRSNEFNLEFRYSEPIYYYKDAKNKQFANFFPKYGDILDGYFYVKTPGVFLHDFSNKWIKKRYIIDDFYIVYGKLINKRPLRLKCIEIFRGGE